MPTTVTRRLTDPERRSPARWARARRRELLRSTFPDLTGMCVLDLGGEVHSWLDGDRPAHVTLLNLSRKARLQQERIQADGLGAWMAAVAGDACDPPAEVARERYDLVFSNSVIEHVGGHHQRRAFAAAARELGTRYWVQTPNRFFPIEPHWLCPGVHFLPTRGRAAVLNRWPLGSFSRRGKPLQERMTEVLSIELQSATDLAFYFPDGRMLRERVAGTTKSLIVVR